MKMVEKTRRKKENERDIEFLVEKRKENWRLNKNYICALQL